MVKFLAHDKTTGAPLYGFGLSDRNLELLKTGRPIVIKLSELDPSLRGEILIFHGTTEDTIAKQLVGWVPRDTTIHEQNLDTEHL